MAFIGTWHELSCDLAYSLSQWSEPLSLCTDTKAQQGATQAEHTRPALITELHNSLNRSSG